ncbi:MAG: hypothetical protein FWD57_16395 [Polyangiaceae bacterium]|nr:hypothetical protein [Polyangiaceae bacterium]
MAVHPDGTLFFAASDEKLQAISPSDGKPLWVRDHALAADGTMSNPIAGVGDRLFLTHNRVAQRSDGEPIQAPTVNGKKVNVYGAAFSRKLLASYSYSPELFVLDECGQLVWSLQAYNAVFAHSIVGFDDSLLTTATAYNGVDYGERKLYRYSIDGTVLAGPYSTGGVTNPLALGADGVYYVATCPLGDTEGDLELLALSESFELVDKVNLGPPCGASGVLLDDGMLVITRSTVPDYKPEFVRVQTASPGLAKTAWPTNGRDNSRTAWLAAW